MNACKQILNRSLVMICVISFSLLLTGCCDSESHTYIVEANYSLDQNSIEVNTAFELSLELPDNLLSQEGDLVDISNVDFKFRVDIFKYSQDTLLDFWAFENSVDSFDVQTEVFHLEEILIADPTPTVGGRTMRFRITPTVKDTFGIIIYTNAILEGTGSCAPFHYLGVENNQLPINEAGLGLTDEVSSFEEGEQTWGLLIFEVI